MITSRLLRLIAFSSSLAGKGGVLGRVSTVPLVLGRLRQ